MNKNTTFYAIGSRIKQVRLQKGMTQLELAEKVGYKTASAINKIETGANQLTVNKIIEFAYALNVSYSYLVGEKNAKQQRTAWDDVWRKAHISNPTSFDEFIYGQDMTIDEKFLSLSPKQKDLIEFLTDKIFKIEDNDVRLEEIKSFIEFKFMKY